MKNTVAVLVVSAATLMSWSAVAPAGEPSFTQAECKLIATVASETVKAVGGAKLSVAFRQSFVDWLGAKITCDGPLPIKLPTGPDIDAYNTIRVVLGAGSHPLDLQKRGVTVE